MDIPEGTCIKPPMVLLIHHWGLLIFGIMKTSDLFQQWFYASSIVKDKDLTTAYAIRGI
jgi:hypothetical protein